MKTKLPITVAAAAMVIASVGTGVADPYVDNANTHVLLHMETVSGGPGTTPDDDSANPGRDNNAMLIPADWTVPYDGPLLGNSFDAAYGNALYFNGVNQSLRVGASTTDDLGIPNNDVRIELNARLDHVKANDNSLHTLFYQASKFSAVITDRSSGDWRLDFTIWIDGTTVKQVTTVIADPTAWNHYALEFMDGQLEGLVNGGSVGAVAAAGSLVAPIRQLYIGGNHSSTRWWTGPIDEFRATTIPEPSVLGLMAVVGGGILFVRKTFRI